MQSILTGEAKHSRFFSQSFLSAKLEENLGQTETLTQRDKPAGGGEISGEGEKTASAATGIASIFLRALRTSRPETQGGDLFIRARRGLRA